MSKIHKNFVAFIALGSFFISLLIIVTACTSTQVIKRDRYGKIPREKPRDDFYPMRKRITVLNLFNEAPYGGDDIAVVATEDLLKELEDTNLFVFDSMDKTIFGSSKEIYSGAGVKLVQLSRKAKMHGINFVIYGRIIEARVREKTDEIGMVRKVKSYTESSVELRIFDVNSNKEIFTNVFKGYADDLTYRFFKADSDDKTVYRRELLRYGVKVAVRKSIPEIMKLSQKLEWTGRVAKIINNQIYINAGRKSGIQIGDILKVITEGTEIYDPETGSLIGISKGEIKGTIEVTDYFGDDGAMAILHSGGAVSENDLVQLY